MKKILIILFFTISAHSVFTQNDIMKNSTLRCAYNLTYQYDSTDSKSIRSEKMILYTNQKESKFASANHLVYEDSLKNVMLEMFNRTGELNFSGMNMPRTKFKFQIFKINNKIIVYEKNIENFYKYAEDKNIINWELDNEKKIVNGLMCQKARGFYAGRKYTAWFSTTIPISDGPYKFSGLPGLIVKIYDDRNHYTFELNGMSKVEYSINKRPDNYINSSKKEVFDMNKVKRENPLQYMNQLGTFNLSPEELNNLKRRYAKHNNPIELKLTRGD